MVLQFLFIGTILWEQKRGFWDSNWDDKETSPTYFVLKEHCVLNNVTDGLIFILNKSWAFLFSSSKRQKELKLGFSSLMHLVENVSTENIH